MSFGFLVFLLSGDLTSFAGCYLTSQLPIQVNTDNSAWLVEVCWLCSVNLYQDFEGIVIILILIFFFSFYLTFLSLDLSHSQVVTVVFYIFTDLILVSQFLYYKIKNSSSRSES